MHTWRPALTSALVLGLLAGSNTTVSAAEADARISYTSQPDRLAVFLNDIAYAEDEVTLPGGVDVRVVLPATVFPDTLILREDDRRVPAYRLDRRDGQLAISWRSAVGSGLREVSLEYLLSGVSWRPTYDLWLGADEDESVELDLLAEITDGALELDDVEALLVAGQVDLWNAVDIVTELRAEQALAGGNESDGVVAVSLGQTDIQHVYAIGRVTAEPGETAYLAMAGQTLPARRVHIWDAQTNDKVTVIYKITNETELPFPQGVVRTYQGGLFIGSDFIETTPMGSEGSVTVGHLQDVRVLREESRTAIDLGRFDYLDEVKLSVTNFGEDTLHLEVVDIRQPQAEDLHFSVRPMEEPGNILRWQLAVEPGATMTVGYDFKVD